MNPILKSVIEYTLLPGIGFVIVGYWLRKLVERLTWRKVQLKMRRDEIIGNSTRLIWERRRIK